MVRPKLAETRSVVATLSKESHLNNLISSFLCDV